MRCEYCDTEINDNEARYAHSNVYCESCFEESFTYCSRCDAVITRSEACYDDCGDGYCNECYEENYDDDCPDNPAVNDLDRQLIIHLSRNWLQCKVDNRKPIEVNEYDKALKEIRIKLGLVEKPIYCYGLVDREEYQITASFDLIDQIQKYFAAKESHLKVQFTAGTRRLGISQTLRTNNSDLVLDLLKSLTSNTDSAATAA